MRRFTRAMFLIACTLLCAACAGVAKAEQASLPRDITFISTSDAHYKSDEKQQQNKWNHETLQQINSIEQVSWPQKLGGNLISRPRAVVMLGDCIDDGDLVKNGRNLTREQYEAYVADFGLDGTDGFLKFSVLDGWGNHDGPPEGKGKCGFSFQAALRQRNQARLRKGLISGISSNGLHYSWDWADVHFVQLNLYPADRQRDGVRYSPVWHDPQMSLSFLKEDLAKNVGKTGRPVVLLSHCGFDTNWWSPEDWKDLYDAAQAYNVVLYIYGHTGTGLRDWSPDSRKKWTCINDGNTTAGFFVIQIKGDRLRAAYRTRAGVKLTKNPDGTLHREWSGAWDWKWLLDRNLHP